MMYDAFISYRSPDESRAGEIAERLRAAGYAIWFAPCEQATLGNVGNVEPVIRKAISDSRRVILCHSHHVASDSWPIYELLMRIYSGASQKSNKSIVVMLDETRPPFKVEYISLERSDKNFWHNLYCHCGCSDYDNMPRRQLLWQFAYAFYRLDQLPWGGWSKTLHGMMEAIWAGVDDTISREPKIQTLGGGEMLSMAVYQYALLLERFPANQRVALMQASDSIRRAIRVFSVMMNKVVGTTPVVVQAHVQGGYPEIRHTALSLAALLKLKLVVREFSGGDAIIGHGINFLLNNENENWGRDSSFVFGMWAALCKVAELLGHFEDADVPNAEKLASLLAQKLPMLGDMAFGPRGYSPRPRMPNVASDNIFPVPYGRFWRMQRAGFVMSLPFLVTEEGECNPAANKHDNELGKMIGALVKSIPAIAANDDSRSWMVEFHQQPSFPAVALLETSPDWGITASLLDLLRVPWISVHAAKYGNCNVDKLRGELRNSLLKNFDQYSASRRLFRFTTGISFARVLQDFTPNAIRGEELRPLDDAINRMLRTGVTEFAINGLVKFIVGNSGLGAHDNAGSTDSLREFLVEKLVSGRYTPDPDREPGLLDGYEPLCDADTWKTIVMRSVNGETISAYDGEVGIEYCERYKKPREIFVNILSDRKLLSRKNFSGLKAIDIGCGPGQYAALLHRRGFEVTLIDASSQMLSYSANRLGLTKRTETQTLDSLLADISKSQGKSKGKSRGKYQGRYDLVFACAILVHVPRWKTEELYDGFFKLLRPGGVLFVNFKIGDHTLIARDGRFYEYYEDESIPVDGLRRAGFMVDHYYREINHENLYKRKMDIRWVNLWCVKPCPRIKGEFACPRSAECLRFQGGICEYVGGRAR